jgi:two-component system, OmpR family, sensor histidine kinase CiaH
MDKSSGKRIRFAIIIYWLLLLYIIAALIWWFISLQKQNRQMAEFKNQQVAMTINKDSNPALYLQKMNETHEKRRNLIKYIGEGLTFLVLSILGAIFVYRSIKKQFLYQVQQKNFMMAVTHELKTPISVARLNLETILKHQLDPDKQKKLLQMTLQETSRLNSLTNNILVSSQLEGESFSISREELDFTSLVKDCVQEARNRYPERVFKEELEPEIEISGDAFLLQIMISNLIENAVKYSPREKPITCLLHKKNNHVQLNLIDEGMGIADEEKLKIFEKFYRTGNEATRKTQGTGLGLYLCRKIAHDHNADISVTNNILSGSNFAIIFHLA